MVNVIGDLKDVAFERSSPGSTLFVKGMDGIKKSPLDGDSGDCELYPYAEMILECRLGVVPISG